MDDVRQESGSVTAVAKPDFFTLEGGFLILD